MQTAAYDPALDGVDHINVFSRGRTELGRVLSKLRPHALHRSG